MCTYYVFNNTLKLMKVYRANMHEKVFMSKLCKIDSGVLNLKTWTVKHSDSSPCFGATW